MSKSLLAPKSIAIIGASTAKHKVGHEILANLVNAKFEGEIVPVNPNADEICGQKCYSHIKEYKNRVELGIVVLPKQVVFEAVRDLAASGVRAIIIITAGFKEVDEEGRLLEQQIAGFCKDRRIDLLGPNCLGAINTHHSMNASFASHMPIKGDISVVSQSGALCTAILDWAAARKLGLAKLVSMGNKAHLCETELLKYLYQDDFTKVIVGYLESIEDGPNFMRVAQEVSSQKPLIIFKSGVTDAGSKAASSHTGSLSGGDVAYGAAFKRSGVIRAETFEQMFDFAIGFSMQPLPTGDRVAIITNAGGPGIMAADAVEQNGMTVSPLAKVHASALRDKLPLAASVSNPIDVLGDADSSRYVSAVEAAQDDDSIDGIVIILTPQAMTNPHDTAIAIANCTTRKKPLLVSFMGGLDVQGAKESLVRCSIPDYPSPERAVKTLKAMWDYKQWLNRPPRVLTRFSVNKHRVQRIINRHLKTEVNQVGEASAKSILKAYGFNVPEGSLASSGQEAIEIAERTGFPVAMKIASPDIIHKSDLGGVKLNLNNNEAVEDAFDLMMLRMKQKVPHAKIHGVYVEKMCQKGREVILGMTRDPQFGPMLMFGLGGIFVEVMKDVTFNIAPLTNDEAMQMLKSTKSATGKPVRSIKRH